MNGKEVGDRPAARSTLPARGSARYSARQLRAAMGRVRLSLRPELSRSLIKMPPLSASSAEQQADQHLDEVFSRLLQQLSADPLIPDQR